ncbi:GLPGLI family protein [Elizabethkingia miricola]|nr:GLPGLI family protein [Elizabethkingia miricola]NHQ70603.1 GLPGLI family protein [Elizabethkingia miricola]NHQ76619.1 GLPGLI family protein [Elizabethkingia miricola]PSL90069.1 GLPGLI family protein [Elizabethkingia miricola]QHQ88974.1 GLPGLI family protein [Elizabethkingia miricola]
MMLFAQTRVSYNLQIIYSDSLKKNFTMCLDIDDKVYFYDAEFIDPKYSAYKTSETMQFVTRKKGSQENIMLLEDFNHNYYRIKTSDIMNWKLTDSYKMVENYRLQKATTSFGGRQWNVWFCNEVPFTEGPYKFNGLPGLIFEVEDTKGIFKYSLIKIENLNKNLVSLEFNDEALSYTTWDKYNKALLDFYENPYREERDLLNRGGEFIVNDKSISKYDLGNMTKDFQTMIKKNLPPSIEADKSFLRK